MVTPVARRQATITIACARIRRSPTGHRRSSATTAWPLPRRLAMGKILTQCYPSEWRKEVAQRLTNLPTGPVSLINPHFFSQASITVISFSCAAMMS